MIKQETVNEIMHRADIVDVVGQFLKLRKRGINYIANCPFHNEKTPSFNVSPSKGIYKCFGCGKAGNSVSFIQEHEKLSYPEAMRWLADFYKIPFEETEKSPEVQQQQQTGESLRIINEFAANYFHDTLFKTEEGEIVGLSYFKQRGFRKETIEKFKLGYNAEYHDVFLGAALAKGYQHDLLEKAGLVKNRNGIYHDVYRGRVIFPIHGMTGRVVGFGARILKTSDKAPKYINTPENELYIKSKILYGMYQARQSIGKHDECFLVEGYTDVISMHQGGVENVVASSGTSLTEDQLRVIGQLTRNLTILYDGDSAGIKAALRGLDMALSQSFNVQLVLLPDGDDPDSFIQKTGAQGFLDYVKQHKQGVISFRLQIGMGEVGDDPMKKSKLVNEIAESISKINKAEDFSLQDHYIREASQKLKVDESGLVNLVNKYIRDRVETESRDRDRQAAREEVEQLPPDFDHPDEFEAAPSTTATNLEHEWQILRILIEFGHLAYTEEQTVAQLIFQRVDPALLEDVTVGKLFNEYASHYEKFGNTPEIHIFTNYPDPVVRNKLSALLHAEPHISENWSLKYGIKSINDRLPYMADVESSLSYYENQKVMIFINDTIKKLETETDPREMLRLQMKFLELKKLEREILQKHEPVVFKSLKFK